MPHSLTTARDTVIRVRPTSPSEHLAPIALVIEAGATITGPFTYHDFLTQAEARELAAALVAEADTLLVRGALTVDDELERKRMGDAHAAAESARDEGWEVAS